MNEHTKTSEFALPVDGGPHDPLEDEVRRRVRSFICVFHAMMGTCSTRRWAVIPRDRGQV